MSYKLAFASKDGSSVDLHFGLADHFLIFQIDDDGKTVRFLENRHTTAACMATCCSKGNEEKAFCEVSKQLNDVQAIFVSKIGEGAAQYLEDKGKVVYEAAYPIKPLINKIITDKIYTKDKWQYPTKY